MADEFDDGFRDSHKKDLNPSNKTEIPKRKTAVALEDRTAEREIPVIKAAGRGKIAEKILQLAAENDIKIRQDSDLAEMLANIEIDSPIPSEAFMAVAEILAYLYQANGQPNPFDVPTEDEE